MKIKHQIWLTRLAVTYCIIASIDNAIHYHAYLCAIETVFIIGMAIHQKLLYRKPPKQK